MDRYITVTSNNAMAPYERMKDLMTKVNEKAKEGYHILGTPTDLHMYGTRWQTAVMMELDKTERAELSDPDCIHMLDLSTRTSNALTNNEIRTVGELKAMTRDEISNMRGIGQKAVEEILNALRRYDAKKDSSSSVVDPLFGGIIDDDTIDEDYLGDYNEL